MAWHRPEALTASGMLWMTRLAYAYAYAGLFVMWGVWTLLVIFLCGPRAILELMPLPTIDAPAHSAPLSAALIDVGLVALFGLQHSIMARPWFKARLSALPPALQRVTYVHAANLALLVLIFAWQPLPELVWQVTWKPLETGIWLLFAAGWLILLAGALSFGIRDLLGIRAVEAWAERREAPRERLKTGFLYRWLAHPMYVGVLTAFRATPRMSVGHLLLATGMTLYVGIALHYETRDLQTRFGPSYDAWRT